ncbi:MAG: hypothetical protein ACI9FO_000910 [Methylophagaceae bacterium]|jgi:hypothetical protein
MIEFTSLESAFSSGGNRLCFVDPNDELRCIKIARPEREPQKKRAEKSFPGNLRPLSYFDENISDLSVYRHIDKSIGSNAYKLMPKCYGDVETNFGRGLAFELIKDTDGQISITLKQYVWLYGLTESLKPALNTFLTLWQSLGMPSRNLLLHNIVVQQDISKGESTIIRLVVIDGLGWPDILPLAYYFPPLARYKACRKAARLQDAIDRLIKKQATGGDWGLRGWMDNEQRKK